MILLIVSIALKHDPRGRRRGIAVRRFRLHELVEHAIYHRLVFCAKRDFAVGVGGGGFKLSPCILDTHRCNLVHIHAVERKLRMLERRTDLLGVVLGHRDAVAVATCAGRSFFNFPCLIISRRTVLHARKHGGIGKRNLVARISARDDLVLDLEVFLIGHVKCQSRT